MIACSELQVTLWIIAWVVAMCGMFFFGLKASK